MDTEVRRRITTGTNTWGNVEWVMGDRWISRKLKGKMLTLYVSPVYMYGLEMTELIEKQHKVQVCGNNSIRRIVEVKRAYKRRMDELKVEVGVF